MWRAACNRFTAMLFSSSPRQFSAAFAAFAFAVITLFGARARADGGGPDRVTLRNGHTFQGTMQLVEIDASYVKMTLDDGKVITIPSQEIARIERTAPDLVEPEKAGDDDPGVVYVSFHADPEVRLETRDGKDDRWRVACREDCETELPIAADYHVAGGGIRTSKPFRLIGKNGDHVLLRPETHSRSQLGAGITLVSVSSVALLASFAHESHCESYDGCGHTFAAWAVTTGLGFAGNALGTVLIALNPHSKVLQKMQTGASSLLARSPTRPHLETTDRAPVAWHSASLPFASSAHASTLFTIRF